MKIDKNPLKKAERNLFGGKNKHALYVPLTDTELEVLERLALSGEFKVIVKDWGYVQNFRLGKYVPETWDGSPIVQFGDKRISFYFVMNFSAPAVPQPNWFFDMEIWAKGRKLHGPQRYPTTNGGYPVQIAAGMQMGLALDLAIDQIDPALIKEIKPDAMGLTSRHGNMHLNLHEQRVLRNLQKSERSIRQMGAKDAAKVTKQSGS